MDRKRFLGWQLVLVGAIWAASVGWWLEEPVSLLARWPSAAIVVSRQPGLAEAWQFIPLVPGALAFLLGVACLLAARTTTPSWEEIWD